MTGMYELSGTELDAVAAGASAVAGAGGLVALAAAVAVDNVNVDILDHNTVIGTRADTSSGLRNRRGLAVLADFQSEADLWRNRLVGNAVAMGRTTNAILRTTSRPGW